MTLDGHLDFVQHFPETNWKKNLKKQNAQKWHGKTVPVQFFRCFLQSWTSILTLPYCTKSSCGFHNIDIMHDLKQIHNMYLYVYISSIYINKIMNKHMIIYKYSHVSIFICMYLYKYIRIYMHIHTRRYLHIYKYIYTSFICIYICM